MVQNINSRKLAVQILQQVFQNNAYSNIAIARNLNRSQLSDKDRALVTELVYGTIKYKYTIDKILGQFIKTPLDKLESIVLNILRISIYQMKYLDKIPQFAAVNESVELAKKDASIGASKLINGVLRNFIRSIDKKYYNEKDNIEKLCFEYSFEPWMVKLFIKQYGHEAAVEILKGSNSVPGVTVRVNTLKSDYDQVWESLVNNGYNIEEGDACPEAIRINKGRNIENNPLFIQGLITVQDESAMLVAPCMDLGTDMEVLDMCSAPGGKTTHIAELMKNTGTVKAYDKYEAKLKLVKDAAERLGINNILCNVIDAEEYNESLNSKFDRVLLDVPCSGLGIIRKKPEIKWTKNYNQLKNIVSVQRNIINNGARYVKKGGILVYSTCTLNKEENEGIINEFLKQNPAYALLEVNFGNLHNFIYSKEGYVTILPGGNMDGFFIAKLKRLW